MTIEKLIEKARDFEKKNKSITWKPNGFPEDMTEEGTIDELISEGDNMYDALKEAVELIKEAYNDSERSGREYERVVRYVESILADEKNEKE